MKSLVGNNGTYFITGAIEPCNHEEADTRLLLHCKHTYDRGFRKLDIAVTESDVFVICISFYALLARSELWVDFGAIWAKIPFHEAANFQKLIK